MFLSVALAAVWTSAALQASDAAGEAVYRKVADSVVLLVVENAAHQEIGQGTGFIISESRIVTNAHVARLGTVLVKSGAFKVPCVVQRMNDVTDLAVLKPTVDLSVPPLPLATSPPQNGSRVFAIGNPRGLEKTISEGLISGVRRVDGADVLQMSAAISPGSSGGPIVNAEGVVLGVAVAGLKNAQNVNFAVPVSAVVSLLESNTTESVSDLLGSIKKVAEQKNQVQWNLASNSEWQQLDRHEAELLQTALSIAASPSDLVAISKAATDWHDEIAFEAASKALSVAQTANTYSTYARAAQLHSSFVGDDQQKSELLRKALDAAQRATVLSASAENLYLLADIQEDSAKYAEALANFAKAFAGKLEPEQHWNALRGLIRTSRALNRKVDAANWFNQLKNGGVLTDWDWEGQADYLYKQAQYREAAEIYESLAGKADRKLFTSDFELWKSAAASRYLSDDLDAALRDARSCIAAGSSKQNSSTALAMSQRIVANVLFDRGVYEQGVNAARESITLEPESYTSYLILSKNLERLERYAEAEAAAKTALTLSDGKDASVHFALGSAYFSQKKWGLAKQAYENAAKFDPTDSASAYNVAVSLYNDHFYKDAIVWYQETLRREPSRQDKAEILAMIQRLRDR